MALTPEETEAARRARINKRNERLAQPAPAAPKPATSSSWEHQVERARRRAGQAGIRSTNG